MTREQFNEIYWAAQPPGIAALNRMPRQSPADAEARYVEAVRLATEGHAIDTQIHAEGLEPWATMWLRLRYGYTWVPSILQVPNFDLAPGITGMPGKGYDPKTPMPGSIKVSLNAADYPEFDELTPAPPPAEVVGPVVGVQVTADQRLAVREDLSPTGTVWTDPNGRKWVKKVRASMFGPPVMWWEGE